MIDNGHDHPGGAPEPDWGALSRVAFELRTWVDALPAWSERSAEDWASPTRRSAQAETALAGRLRRMPGCSIARSPNGASTTLILAGVEVRAQGGIAKACQGWIAKVEKAAKGG